MRRDRSPLWLAGLAGLMGFLGVASASYAQAPTPAPAQPPAASPAPAIPPILERRFLMVPPENAPPGTAPAPVPPPSALLACTGPITRVVDVAFEGVRTTRAHYGSNPGGGEGGQFDPVPVLSTRVNLAAATCLDAHLSAMVGSKQTYGPSAITVFQVSLTRPGFGPQHMVGHFHTPWGVLPQSPGVALEAERDVDMFSANFFQRVGQPQGPLGPHEVRPGLYNVDVFWAGGPPPPTPPQHGAIGAAFVLKLYLR